MWTSEKYLIVCVVSLMFVSIFFLYFFIGFKIRHLINSYYKYAIIEVKDMKNEPLKNILADKNESGNFYQCYFNLINLVRELSFCIALYFLVHFPRIVISILTTLQVINLLLMSLYRPYKKSWMNVNLIITNVLYLMLDVVLACLIFGGDRISKEVKYNVFGFGMIGIVFGLLVCNLGISLYFSIVEFIRKRRQAKLEKKMQEEQNLKNGMGKNKTMPTSTMKLLPKVEKASQNEALSNDPVSSKLLNLSTANGSTLLNQSNSPLLDSVSDSQKSNEVGGQHEIDKSVGNQGPIALTRLSKSVLGLKKLKAKVNKNVGLVERAPDASAPQQLLDSVFSKQKQSLRVIDFLAPKEGVLLPGEKFEFSGNGSVENINFEEKFKSPNNPVQLNKVQESPTSNKFINIGNESFAASQMNQNTILSESSQMQSRTQSPTSPHKPPKKQGIIKLKVGSLIPPPQQTMKPTEQSTSRDQQQ